MIENRKNQRFELRLPLEIVRSGHRSSVIHGFTMNLSSNGVMFEIERPIAAGEIIEYFILLPTGQSQFEEVKLRCMGKVIRGHDRYAAATMERYEFVRTRPALVEALVSEAAAS